MSDCKHMPTWLLQLSCHALKWWSHHFYLKNKVRQRRILEVCFSQLIWILNKTKCTLICGKMVAGHKIRVPLISFCCPVCFDNEYTVSRGSEISINPNYFNNTVTFFFWLMTRVLAERGQPYQHFSTKTFETSGLFWLLEKMFDLGSKSYPVESTFVWNGALSHVSNETNPLFIQKAITVLLFVIYYQ